MSTASWTFSLWVAARVVPGRRHECPILYELVEEVVRAVHKGCIKILIVDRGLIDGQRMGYLQKKAGDRYHRPAAHQHGPLRRCHRSDPAAGLRLATLR